ncbi:hypothetical protein, partial [Corynebacterium diphtheriae]|uniref:hypothetical protein n=1 Tax=Corynebacterium diphtheriae TaxID=1717 RepID=UPI001A7E7EC6
QHKNHMSDQPEQPCCPRHPTAHQHTKIKNKHTQQQQTQQPQHPHTTQCETKTIMGHTHPPGLKKQQQATTVTQQ